MDNYRKVHALSVYNTCSNQIPLFFTEKDEHVNVLKYEYFLFRFDVVCVRVVCVS